jgi:hypothetical protein
MTKLEEKLIELGYEEHTSMIFNRKRWVKTIIEDYYLVIYTNEMISEIKEKECFIHLIDIKLYDQYGIDNLQQAYNQLQKDLEVLKEL